MSIAEHVLAAGDMPETYVTGVIQTSGQVQLLIRPPRKQIRDRSTCCPPTAERGSGVPIRQFPLQSRTPAFSIDRGSSIDDGPVQLADIVPRITASPDGLRGKLILSYTELPGRHEVERLSVWNGVRG